MANDIKSGVGFIIPAIGVVGFFTALLLGEFLLSIIIAVMVILIWFLYMLVMESHVPKEMGNMIILFGLMLSLGIFLGFGVIQNMWGGYDLKPEGAIFSLIILFFSVLTGLNFRSQQKTTFTNPHPSVLSDEDRSLVMNAINQNTSGVETVNNEPKVIIVKQEAVAVEKENDEKKEIVNQLNPHDPYGMSSNPYFAYPSDYYEDEDYEDYDEEWEEDEEEDDEEG